MKYLRTMLKQSQRQITVITGGGQRKTWKIKIQKRIKTPIKI